VTKKKKKKSNNKNWYLVKKKKEKKREDSAEANSDEQESALNPPHDLLSLPSEETVCEPAYRSKGIEEKNQSKNKKATQYSLAAENEISQFPQGIKLHRCFSLIGGSFLSSFILLSLLHRGIYVYSFVEHSRPSRGYFSLLPFCPLPRSALSVLWIIIDASALV